MLDLLVDLATELQRLLPHEADVHRLGHRVNQLVEYALERPSALVPDGNAEVVHQLDISIDSGF